MTITVQEIRDALNIPEEKELGDAVIESAISRAGTYFVILAARYSAPSEFIPPAELAWAIYLAYQSYSDRVLNVVPGAYSEGKWDPIAEEIVRSTGEKLRDLRQVADDLIGIIKSYPTRPTGTFHCSTTAPRIFGLRQFDYPYSRY
jgi:hypothetical protein